MYINKSNVLAELTEPRVIYLCVPVEGANLPYRILELSFHYSLLHQSNVCVWIPFGCIGCNAAHKGVIEMFDRCSGSVPNVICHN